MQSTQFGMGYIASGRMIAGIAPQAPPARPATATGGAPMPALAPAARIPTPER
jgi:hypothetical protein